MKKHIARFAVVLGAAAALAAPAAPAAATPVPPVPCVYFYTFCLVGS